MTSRTRRGPVKPYLLSTDIIHLITVQINDDNDWNHHIEEEFPGPVSLIETTSPSEIQFDNDLYYHADSGFNICKSVYLGQYHAGSRGRNPADVGFLPWSPAAWFGGGARHLFDASPVDCLYESRGYPRHCICRGMSATLMACSVCLV